MSEQTGIPPEEPVDGTFVGGSFGREEADETTQETAQGTQEEAELALDHGDDDPDLTAATDEPAPGERNEPV